MSEVPAVTPGQIPIGRAEQFAEPGRQLSRFTLVVAVHDSLTRAELHQWEPGARPSGHLVWQHRLWEPSEGHNAGLYALGVLATTVSWLEHESWPGVSL